MERNLQGLNSENIKMLNPMIYGNYDGLQNTITQQKNDNAHLQKQLTELKKEKSQMQQQILNYQARINQLEDMVGI